MKKVKKKLKVRKTLNSQKKKSLKRKRSQNRTKEIKSSKCSLRKTILQNLKDG
jgi:hypothetical protein